MSTMNSHNICSLSNLSDAIKPGSVNIIAGGPCTYKTSLCFALIDYLIRHGNKIIYPTIECSEKELSYYIHDLYKCTEVTEEPLCICQDDTHQFNVDSLREYMIELKKNGKGFQYLILDYLNLISPVGGVGNHFDVLIAKLKDIAKEFNVAVIGVIQLGVAFVRIGSDKCGKRPTKKDLNMTSTNLIDLFISIIRWPSLEEETTINHPSLQVENSKGEIIGKFTFAWHSDKKILTDDF